MARAAVISRLHWGKSTSKLTPVGRIQLLTGCWTDWEAALSSLTCGPLYKELFTTCQLQVEQVRECQPVRQVTKFYNLIVEMLSHHFSCILFIKSESLSEPECRLSPDTKSSGTLIMNFPASRRMWEINLCWLLKKRKFLDPHAREAESTTQRQEYQEAEITVSHFRRLPPEASDYLSCLSSFTRLINSNLRFQITSADYKVVRY